MTRFVQAIAAARSPTPALAPTPRTTRALLRHCASGRAPLCGRLPIYVSPLPCPQYPFDKTKMTEVRAWVNESDMPVRC